MDLSTLTPVSVPFTPYHDGVPKRTWQLPPEAREFVAWDGEGQNVDGVDKPQHYVLFGSSHSDPVVSESHIHTFTLLDHILRVGIEHPTAFHVGFAFGYDSNMIIRSLHENAIEQLHKTGKLALRRMGRRYFINYIPGKWFSISRYGENYDRKRNPHDKVTVKIYDLFSFFNSSFIAAYEKYVGPVPDVVRDGKANRNNFADLSAEYVLTYWRREIQMLVELANELRKRLYGADLPIREWHGPGALASYANRKHGVRQYMRQCPDPVREAARYAYAGGRFEMFQLGRREGPIYSLDINSAYPHGIRMLPSLNGGEWVYVRQPKRLARFGVYRIRLHPRHGGSFLERAPGPLFHRDKMGNISFPWMLEGWYWSPEARAASKLHNAELVEGWEYVGWSGLDRPFQWVEDTYALRRQWKADKNPAELALKLLLNSLYGKMAQRVGWDQDKRTAPVWHQLEWAGWVTSNTRAMLWDAMWRILARDRKGLLAVETDGLYTTVPPEHVIGNSSDGGDQSGNCRVESSTELGGWEIDVYDEILYVQSGLAWLRKGDNWICKRRGLDARTFQLDACRDYLRSLQPGKEWLPYVGQTTRFIGMGAALASSLPTKSRLGLWETVNREIRPGQGGKRIHVPSQCAACKSGLTPWEQTHDMSIRSLAYSGDTLSRQHDIPWENGDQGYTWREAEKESQGLVMVN